MCEKGSALDFKVTVFVMLPDTFLPFCWLFPSQTAGFAIAILQTDHEVPMLNL